MVEFIRHRATDYRATPATTKEERRKRAVIRLRGCMVYGLNPLAPEVEQLARALEYFRHEELRYEEHTHVCETCAIEWSGHDAD